VSEAETKAGTEARTNAETEAATEARTDAGTQADTEARSNARTDAETEAETEARADAGSDARTARPVVHRFDEIAASLAGAVAIRSRDHVWTYAELAETSRRIATTLTGLTGSSGSSGSSGNSGSSGSSALTAPGARVGFVCDPSAPAIATILAILRAGLVWCPIDPHQPRARIDERLRDLAPQIIVYGVADPALADHLARSGARSLDQLLAADPAPIPATGDLPRDAPLAPNLSAHTDRSQIAYVLYTSGSTGRPKGVVQSQRNLLFHAQTYARSLALTPGDRLALLTSLAVDAGIMDIFGALLTGASLALWNVAHHGVDRLAAWVTDEAITVVHATPTLFRYWLGALAPAARLPSVRRVVLGGEPARYEDLAVFRRVFGDHAVLINGLGPTESTLALQASFAAHDLPPAGDGRLPVGRPVADTEVFLLGPDGQPADHEGELAIRSDHLALGYWGDPDATRAVFLPPPVDNTPDTRNPPDTRRTWRSGDRLRRLPDGSYTWLGRTDARHKLRGVAIDLDELEAHLRAQGGVREAAAIIANDALIAFVTTDAGVAVDGAAVDGAAVDGAGLIARLRDVLPAAMIPAAIHVLDALPKTTSGKLARTALAGRATASTTERWVAGAFAELLGADDIHADTSFFELGGHSLAAMSLLARARDAFDADLTQADIFEAPTVAALAARIDGARRAPLPAIQALPRRDVGPVSCAQERLLFYDRLAPGSPTYHVPAAMWLRGAVDAAALQAALGDVVRRHTALRATFAIEASDGRLVQRVVDDLPVALEVTPVPGAHASAPVAHASAPDARCSAINQARAFASRPFDLARGPLLRAALFSVTDDEHLLILVVHHIAADGHAMRQLCREWSVAYAARRQGHADPTTPPPFQYLDYAAWQHRVLASDALAAARAWWQQRVAAAAILELPLDRPRPPVPSRGGKAIPFTLPVELVARLRALAHETGTSLYMICLAAFGLFLGRHADQDDISIGSPVTARPSAALEHVIGTFVNTIVMRLDLSGAPTVRELLARARRVTLDALARADVPFEQVVAGVTGPRDPSREPLFQTMLIVHQGPGAHLDLDGVTADPVELHLDVAMCDLSLTVRDAGSVDAWFEYATDLFDDATVQRFIDRLVFLLGELAAAPDRLTSELEIVPPAERLAILGLAPSASTPPAASTSASSAANTSANPAASASPAASPSVSPDRLVTITEQILARAAISPLATAVTFEGAVLTYRELLERSAALAQTLAHHGILPGAPVPVLVERSLDLVPALLGVLLAGAWFVPLDPGWPDARVRAALDLLRPAAVVAPHAVHDVPAAWFSSDTPGAIPLPGAAPLQSAQTTPTLPLVARSPDAPVYGFFTSGSTGRPKLAVVAHHGLANRFAWMDTVFGTTPVTLQTTPHAFDSAVWQLLWPLCSGGHAVVPTDAAALSAEALTQLIERHGVTIIDFVPSVLDALLPSFPRDPALPGKLATLHHVILGGEALHASSVRALRGLLPGVRVFNLYGPTEATIGCIAAEVTGSEDVIPIGHPITNVRAAVLDHARRLVPIGVPGELYLGGACVGLGYFGDPDATRNAFLALPSIDPPIDSSLGPSLGPSLVSSLDPSLSPSLDSSSTPSIALSTSPSIAPRHNPRWYRTGDLVRQRADGSFVFLGRIDDQIKLRGLRIEPGEIEAVLRQHASVQEAAVALRSGRRGPELWAWVVPDPPPDDVRHFLHERLPIGLVPARFIGCAHLPHLGSGKIDRRHLPDPGDQIEQVPERAPHDAPAQTTHSAPERAPHDDLERTVAEAWKRALGLEHIDPRINFFDAGGNSLLAMTVQRHLQDALHCPISLVTLFRYPTVGELASALRQAPDPDSDRETFDRERRAATARRSQLRTRSGDA